MGDSRWYPTELIGKCGFLLDDEADYRAQFRAIYWNSFRPVTSRTQTRA